MAAAYRQYANLGMGQEEYIERAKEYANKALALKPDLADALAMLGQLSIYEDYPKNLHDTFLYLKKALSADPFSTRALTSLALNYADIGKSTESYAYADLNAERDPLDPWRYLIKGTCYFWDCKFGPALEQFRAFYGADSTSRMAQDVYSLALTLNGRRDEALAVLNAGINTPEAEVERNVETGFCLLLKYALLKDKESGLRVLTPEFQKTCRRDFEWSYEVAHRLSLLGAKDEALDWLENAIARGFINYPSIQCDPFLDNIRGEERFKTLAQKVKYEWEHYEVPE
jgi:non-specific serine/threonine protein kinase